MTTMIAHQNHLKSLNIVLNLLLLHLLLLIILQVLLLHLLHLILLMIILHHHLHHLDLQLLTLELDVAILLEIVNLPDHGGYYLELQFRMLL
jgi:hypothetical protein